MADKIIQWNNKLLTFNQKLIRTQSVATPVAATYPTDQLVERWGFADNTGLNGKTFSGSGTYNQSGPSAGLKSVALDGTNVITMADDADIKHVWNNHDYTIAYWLNCASTPTGQRILIRAYTANYKAGVLHLIRNAETSIATGMTCPEEADYMVENGTTNVRDSSWHLIIASRTTNSWTQYVDNSADGSATGNPSGWGASTSSSFTIGESLPCNIGPFYIYGKVLTSDERTQLWNSGNGV